MESDEFKISYLHLMNDSIDLRLKYEEKRVKDLGIGSDCPTLIHKENQIFRKFLSRQDVGGFKSVVLAIDLRLKHAPNLD